MRFRGLDLNLLVALDALMTERKLTAAARSINLSQPAMSAAVARLRSYFRDELFTMRGRELVPTPRAEALAAPTREALPHIQLSITSREAFDPAQSERCFKIGASDYATLVFLRNIIERVARDAPAVSLRTYGSHGLSGSALHRGEIDFLILPELYMTGGHPKARLYEKTFVCVGCRSNKQLSRQLTFERYMSMGQVAVKFCRTRIPSIEEWFLLEHGLKRRLEVIVQGFSMVPPLFLDTDRIATMPLTLAKHFAKTMPLRLNKLPLPLSGFTEAVQWTALHNTHPASIWMRQLLLEQAARMSPQHENSRARRHN
ncbi:LysR family transcriptional regulator [Bradyrhizobium sp. Cp5.3]|uniref:LysR family transcriptional regulator n=1 Tax=Bradyrhizobium sp. Cp5.3 TaxID=443598 RepID=UPI000408A820|nr:LysR family transcriptional regulator [Bradyrhizobium sp. Cp5.3]